MTQQATLFGDATDVLDRLRNPVLTAKVGKNAPLFADICRLYAPDGSRVLDMTYGLGGFWTPGLESRYKLVKMDIERPATMRGDFEALPFRSNTFDVAVFDPPYANHGSEHATSYKDGIDRSYNLKAANGTKVIMRMYEYGIAEAARVAPLVIVKCQDHIESGKQHWTHVTVMEYARSCGLTVEDLFVLVQDGVPTMRHAYQLHARKNHSYFVVARRK